MCSSACPLVAAAPGDEFPDGLLATWTAPRNRRAHRSREALVARLSAGGRSLADRYRSPGTCSVAQPVPGRDSAREPVVAVGRARVSGRPPDARLRAGAAPVTTSA